MTQTVSVLNLTKGKHPRLPFALYKDTVLGKTYELSVVFVGPARMRTINRTRRGFDKSTDILSFDLGKNLGEIFLCETAARKKAKEFDMTYTDYFPYLFVHGLTHLRGLDHGKKMDALEKSFCKKLGIRR